ncbi:MAG: hypothetical protein ACLQJR_32735 [Stellaceae bacterium]
MAQVFPSTPDEGTLDEAQRALAETLVALPDAWILLRDRWIGETPVDAVLIHPGIGVALVDLAPRSPEGALEGFRAVLEREAFARFFPGELPLVAVSIAAHEIAEIGERLADAFDAVPLLAIADCDWADAVVELLLLPSDVTMAPAGASTAPEPEPPRAPVAAPVPERARARAAAPMPLLLLEDELPPTRLRADYPMADTPAPRERRGLVAGTVMAGLVIVVIAGAWSLGEGQAWLPGAPPPGQAEITLPLAPAASPAPAPAPRADATAPEPPLPPAAAPAPHAEVTAAPPPSPAAATEPSSPPAAPPVVMAAKQAAALPPAPPRPTEVAPLPQATAEAATTPPAFKAKPRRVTRVAADESKRLMRRELGDGPAAEAGPLAPPIDASDLPPLDRAAGPSPDKAAAPPPAQPAQALAPAAAAPQQASAIEATPLPADAPTVASAAPAARNECRPYTADTTLTGRSIAVEGTACRGTDGQWRLVSEVPQH